MPTATHRPRAAVALALFALVTIPVSAQYPTISSLDASDPLFQQQQSDMRIYYIAAGNGEPSPPLLMYRYSPEPADTLFGIAARLSVPYSAVATLNRMPSSALEGREALILPSIPGVFVPMRPTSDLETLMADLRKDEPAIMVVMPESEGGTTFRFYPGEDFLPEERRAFLGLLFRDPLRTLDVSSRYGQREHPITDRWAFHHGVDLAAPKGSWVMAARAGVVAELGFDETLGNYVLLQHTGGFQSFYGHLETIVVSLNQELASGMILGTVGDTGMTTGSHLHFEIRQNGDTRDPLSLLP